MPGPLWAELAADEILLQLRLNPGSTSAFVDTHQWSPLRRSPECSVGGGHANAQLRRVALGHEPQVTCWKLGLVHMPPDVKNARQLRGHLYRNGVKEGDLGDIVVSSHVALATVLDVELLDLLPEAVFSETWDAPEVATERATASALRLDAVVAALFHVSRSEAQTAIEYGFIFLNFEQAGKRTNTVTKGDQLVYRTKGRAEIVECDSTTKSGRTAVVFKRFPI